jgi:predicted HicB family RNase H-like nuclease
VTEAATTEPTRTTAILRMPTKMKAALQKAAAKDGLSLNDYAVGILARKYGVAYLPSGRRSTPMKRGGESVILRMPQEIHRALSLEAFDEGKSLNTIACVELAQAVEMTYEPPTRGAPKKRVKRS